MKAPMIDPEATTMVLAIFPGRLNVVAPLHG